MFEGVQVLAHAEGQSAEFRFERLGPGVMDMPAGGNRVGVFSVAVSNVGVAGEVTVSADTRSRGLEIEEIGICRTDPASGACTSPRQTSQTLTLGADETATFGFFVRGTGAAIANDPANNRVFVRFSVDGDPVSATSTAVRTE